MQDLALELQGKSFRKCRYSTSAHVKKSDSNRKGGDNKIEMLLCNWLGVVWAVMHKNK